MLCRILGFIAFSFYEGRGWEGGTLCAPPQLQSCFFGCYVRVAQVDGRPK